MEDTRTLRVPGILGLATIALSLAAVPSTVRAGVAGCPPAAIVRGGATTMVTAVVAILRQHGVASRPPACAGRVVRASLDPAAGTRFHHLRIDDGFGRTSDRKVTDARTAASLIETWALAEDASLLSPKPHAAELPSPAPTSIDVGASLAASADVPTAEATWRVAATVDVSTDMDGFAAYGAAATGCGRVGPICVGGRARIASGSQATVLPGFDLTRNTAAFLAIASLPITWRRFTVAPLVGLGGGWARISGLPDPITVARDDVSIRAEAAAIVGLRLATNWSVLAEVGVAAGRRVSGDPSDPLQARLTPPPDFTVGAAVGIEYAR